MKETTSLYNLLKKGVVIPNFQRDYAQGRAGKEDLRTKFLDEIKAHVGKNTVPLELDFVYGTNMDGKICPLDGQQRLTTIWLLMWYCKYMGLKKTMQLLYGKFISPKSEFDNVLKGEEKDEAKKKMLEVEKKMRQVEKNMTGTISDYLNQDEFKCLKNFSYDTRPSSKAFVEWLCNGFLLDPKGLMSDASAGDFSKCIQQRSGFHSVWKQDPTVQSMLRMLKDVNAKFKNVDLSSLFTDESPIQFYYLDLDGIKQSNNLYIKMNARGEQLTGFENFKADLVANLRKEEKYKNFVDLSNENYILKKWDVEWTGLFWSKKGEASAIDGLFFTFIKRFLLNEYILEPEVVNENNEAAENVDAEQIDYRSLLYDNEQGEYITYKPYELLIKKYINNIKIVLDSLSKKDISEQIEKVIEGLPLLKGYSLLPKFMVDSNAKDNQPVVAEANFKERIVMYGICRYLQCGNFDETVFAHWLRVLANLAYYDEMTNFKEYANRLKFVSEVVGKLVDGNGFKDIYEVDLSSVAAEESGVNNCRQLAEEKNKIKLIKDNPGKDVEKSLKELESLWIFEGNIQCLLELKLDNTSPAEILAKLSERFSANIFGERKKKVGDSEELMNLFCAIFAQNDIKISDDKGILINDEHNNLRTILNNDLKTPFIGVLKQLIDSHLHPVDTIKRIIAGYEYSENDWKFALVKDSRLWKFTEKGKLRKTVDGSYFLLKKVYKNEADIPLAEYSRYLDKPENQTEFSFPPHKWSVTKDGITFNETK